MKNKIQVLEKQVELLTSLIVILGENINLRFDRAEFEELKQKIYDNQR